MECLDAFNHHCQHLTVGADKGNNLIAGIHHFREQWTYFIIHHDDALNLKKIEKKKEFTRLTFSCWITHLVSSFLDCELLFDGKKSVLGCSWYVLLAYCPVVA